MLLDNLECFGGVCFESFFLGLGEMTAEHCAETDYGNDGCDGERLVVLDC